MIDREVAEFDERHPKEKIEPKIEEENANDTSKETVGEPINESPSDPAVIDTTNSPTLKAHASEESRTEKHITEEHNGEVVLEHEEDTVIY